LNATVTNLENCKKELHIEIPSQTVQTAIDNKATKYSKQLNVPGFRPGRAPVSVVKTRFFKELRDEVMSELLPQAFEDAVKEHSLKILSEPHAHDVDFGLDDSIKATFVFETAPDFELADYKNLSLTKYVRHIGDEDVEKAIEMLRDARAEMVPVEDRPAQEGDVVSITVSGKVDPDYAPPVEEKTDEAKAEEAAATEGEQNEAAEAQATSGEATNAAENAEAHDHEHDHDHDHEHEEDEEDEEEIIDEVKEESLDIDLGSETTIPEFKEALLSTNPGDTREVTVTYPKDYESKSYANRRWNYQLEVTAVKVKEMPELNDDFAKEVNEKYNNVEELRSGLRENLEANAKRVSENRLRDEALTKLSGEYSFDVPEELLKKQMQQRMTDYIQNLMSYRIDPRALNLDWQGMYEEQRGQATKDLRGFFLLEKVADAENIEVSEEEVEKEVEEMAEASGQSMSMLMARLTKENALDTIKGQIRHQKALDLIIASADIKEVEDVEEEADAEASVATTGGDEERQAEEPIES
jgi:trigger factor